MQANKQETRGASKRVKALMAPRLFKALADPNRVSLLLELADCGGSCTVSEASRCCPVDLSVVSRHLSVLRDAGLVDWERRGKEVHYRLRADVLVRTLRDIADAVESCCATRNCCGPEPRTLKGARK